MNQSIIDDRVSALRYVDRSVRASAQSPRQLSIKPPPHASAIVPAGLGAPFGLQACYVHGSDTVPHTFYSSTEIAQTFRVFLNHTDLEEFRHTGALASTVPHHNLFHEPVLLKTYGCLPSRRTVVLICRRRMARPKVTFPVTVLLGRLSLPLSVGQVE